MRRRCRWQSAHKRAGGSLSECRILLDARRPGLAEPRGQPLRRCGGHALARPGDGEGPGRAAGARHRRVDAFLARSVPAAGEDFTVVAPDLPGHGFTGMPARDGLSLPGMAAGLAALCETLRLEPEIAVGHSAGAAVLIRAALDGQIARASSSASTARCCPCRALSGSSSLRWPSCWPPARWCRSSCAWRAGAGVRWSGCSRHRLEARAGGGRALCAARFSNPGHVAGALGHDGELGSRSARRAICRAQVPLILVAGGEDRAISPDDAFRVRDWFRARRSSICRA